MVHKSSFFALVVKTFAFINLNAIMHGDFFSFLLYRRSRFPSSHFVAEQKVGIGGRIGWKRKTDPAGKQTRFPHPEISAR